MFGLRKRARVLQATELVAAVAPCDELQSGGGGDNDDIFHRNSTKSLTFIALTDTTSTVSHIASAKFNTDVGKIGTISNEVVTKLTISLQHLPIELLLTIFDHLELADLIKLRMLSSDYRALVDRCVVWSRVALRFDMRAAGARPQSRSDLDAFGRFFHSKPAVKLIRLRCSLEQQTRSAKSNVLTSTATRPQSLQIPGCTDRSMGREFALCVQLLNADSTRWLDNLLTAVMPQSSCTLLCIESFACKSSEIPTGTSTAEAHAPLRRRYESVRILDIKCLLLHNGADEEQLFVFDNILRRSMLLNRIGSLFPNLRQLHLRLYAGSCQALINALKSLRHLELLEFDSCQPDQRDCSQTSSDDIDEYLSLHQYTQINNKNNNNSKRSKMTTPQGPLPISTLVLNGVPAWFTGMILHQLVDTRTLQRVSLFFCNNDRSDNHIQRTLHLLSRCGKLRMLLTNALHLKTLRGVKQDTQWTSRVQLLPQQPTLLFDLDEVQLVAKPNTSQIYEHTEDGQQSAFVPTNTLTKSDWAASGANYIIEKGALAWDTKELTLSFADCEAILHAIRVSARTFVVDLRDQCSGGDSGGARDANFESLLYFLLETNPRLECLEIRLTCSKCVRVVDCRYRQFKSKRKLRFNEYVDFIGVRKTSPLRSAAKASNSINLIVK